MSRALIGYTGFVGGTLARQTPFDAFFNSRNISDLGGMTVDTLVCAGAPAAKWLANRDPEHDRATLAQLVAVLRNVAARRVILISSIDVYPATRDADENFDCHAQANHAYGTNRLWLEDQIRGHFPDVLIVRLPGLFGTGLKKNIIYDLLHNNCLDMINPASSFQWYNMDHLWRDIETASKHGLGLVNLFPEPVATGAVLERFFPHQSVGTNPAPEAHYDIKTVHAGVFGGAQGYIAHADSVLNDLEKYIARESAGVMP